jgi:hypothetical protein
MRYLLAILEISVTARLPPNVRSGWRNFEKAGKKSNGGRKAE